LLESLGRCADEDEGLIVRHVHPQVKTSAVSLTHDGEVRSALHAKTSAVDCAVSTNRNGQLAAQLAGHIPPDDDTGTRTKANGGDDLQLARDRSRILHTRSRGHRPLATEDVAQPSQQPCRAKPRNGLPPRDSERHLA